MELNPAEAVTNNILGTQHVVAAAVAAGVERLVMISTDKAVSPTSVMGASKRIAEWIVLDAARQKDQVFSVVRFGNAREVALDELRVELMFPADEVSAALLRQLGEGRPA